MEDDVPVVQGDWTKAINEATVWSGAVTVKGTVYVNAELTIKPGTVVTFREDAQLYVQNEGSISFIMHHSTAVLPKLLSKVPLQQPSASSQKQLLYTQSM